MYLTILVFGIICLIIGIVFGGRYDWGDGWYIAPMVAGVVLTFIFTILCCVSLVDIITVEITIDERIELYESYNADIKLQVDAVAREYVDYEAEIYDNFATQDILLIVPELDANTVIMEQIALYEANELKILELREQRLNLQKDKFLLYWGR